MEERQLTARGKAPTSRAGAWAAWKAAVLEFQRLSGSGEAQRKMGSKKTPFEKALGRNLFGLVAEKCYPNRGTVIVTPIAGGDPIEVKVMGLGSPKWWEFKISQEFPALREAQHLVFEATGHPPKEIELGLKSPPSPGFTREQVLARYQEVIQITGLHWRHVRLEGVSALVAVGVVEKSHTRDTEIEISVLISPEKTPKEIPEGVVALNDVYSWTYSTESICTENISVESLSKVLRRQEKEKKEGYLEATRTFLRQRV